MNAMMKIESALRTATGKALIGAIMVLGMVLGQQHFVHAYAPVKAKAQAEAEQVKEEDGCVRKARLLMVVAQARSQGMQKEALVSASADPTYRKAIDEVYQIDLSGTDEQQQASMNRFALEKLTACLELARK